MTKGVILDYGLVLCPAPQEAAVQAIEALFQIDRAKFWTLYEHNRGPLDKGDLSPADYWREFAVGAGKTLNEEQIDELRNLDIQMWSDLDEPLLHWVDNLRATGYKTSILSNLNKEFAAYMRTQCDWIQRFDHQVFSAEVGSIKPQPEIYRHCLELMQCQPEEVLFIDDRETNVAAARQQGIQALRYSSLEQLRSQLEAMKFEILPEVS